ncbi:MAG: hypothetical protein ACXVP0_02375 [Bacteroidia bacterium]
MEAEIKITEENNATKSDNMNCIEEEGAKHLADFSEEEKKLIELMSDIFVKHIMNLEDTT